ncbi:conserved protein of unknown function [Cupriavidus taiwanensis]|nr:conserved protein of unknown function [Cupriavidus taiwanensis]
MPMRSRTRTRPGIAQSSPAWRIPAMHGRCWWRRRQAGPSTNRPRNGRGRGAGPLPITRGSASRRPRVKQMKVVVNQMNTRAKGHQQGEAPAMMNPIRLTTVVVAATTCLLSALARADITPGQLTELQSQAAMQQAMAMATMIAIIEGCAQTYPALRAAVHGAYVELGVDRGEDRFSKAIGACVDKDSAPKESECDGLVRLAGPPQNHRGLQSFFDAASQTSAGKMIASCK